MKRHFQNSSLTALAFRVLLSWQHRRCSSCDIVPEVALAFEEEHENMLGQCCPRFLKQTRLVVSCDRAVGPPPSSFLDLKKRHPRGPVFRGSAVTEFVQGSGPESGSFGSTREGSNHSSTNKPADVVIKGTPRGQAGLQKPDEQLTDDPPRLGYV